MFLMMVMTAMIFQKEHDQNDWDDGQKSYLTMVKIDQTRDQGAAELDPGQDETQNEPGPQRSDGHGFSVQKNRGTTAQLA